MSVKVGELSFPLVFVEKHYVVLKGIKFPPNKKPQNFSRCNAGKSLISLHRLKFSEKEVWQSKNGSGTTCHIHLLKPLLAWSFSVPLASIIVSDVPEGVSSAPLVATPPICASTFLAKYQKSRPRAKVNMVLNLPLAQMYFLEKELSEDKEILKYIRWGKKMNGEGGLNWYQFGLEEPFFVENPNEPKFMKEFAKRTMEERKLDWLEMHEENLMVQVGGLTMFVD